MVRSGGSHQLEENRRGLGGEAEVDETVGRVTLLGRVDVGASGPLDPEPLELRRTRVALQRLVIDIDPVFPLGRCQLLEIGESRALASVLENNVGGDLSSR